MKGRTPTVAPQWQHVREERKRLRDHEKYPVLDSLEEAWEMLSDFYGSITAGGETHKINDRDDVERLSDSPLSALMFLTEMGMYPPPELLLGLLESWDEYLDGDGEKTLEEVFIGKPKRKAGNYAKRHAEQTTRRVLAWKFVELVNNGMSQAKAAEALTTKYHLRMDAESFIRMARSNWLFPPKNRRQIR
jgi:hypothetical protein